MRSAVAAACLFLVIEPAFACHRFSHWAYPWPQRCGIAARAVHRPPTEAKDWYVEIVLTPQAPDEISRGEAIEKIKQQLNLEKEKP